METVKGSSRTKIVFALLVGSIIIVAGAVAASYHSQSTNNTTTNETSPITSQTSETGTSTIESTTITSVASNRTYGPGPISTYPASWDDPCGYLVQGNVTTGLEIGTMSNANLSQIYSIIVNSSAFQTLADGRTWVTVQWAVGNSGTPQAFVDGDFLFMVGGMPDIDAFATVQYRFDGGNITVFLGTYYPPCTQGTPYFNEAHLVGGNQDSFAVGQPVGINFTVGDGNLTNMTITASTSCLGSFIVVQGGLESDGFPANGPVVYNSAEHPGCSGPPLKEVLNPGQTYAQTAKWDQTYDNGTQVPPGEYQIVALEAGYLGQLFTVDPGYVTVSATQAYGPPGPFSTFPALWYDSCGLPVQGNRTTINGVTDSGFPVAGTINLTLVYSSIVNSSAFQAIAAGKTWVTVDWTLTQVSNSTGLYYFVGASFILISNDSPVSYPQVVYSVATGEVTVAYNGPLENSCLT